MATFPSITPQYSTQETVTQDSLRIKLGDGYEQRLVRGLPANTNVITVNVDANSSDVTGNDAEANQLGNQIAAAIQSELIKQKRAGGLLA